MRLRILLFGNGQFVTLAEIFRRAEIAGHEKVEDGPEIQNGIFQRRAGQHNPMLSPHRFHRLRILRLAILDVLRLVERDGVKFESAIFCRIAADQRVAGHYNVARLNLLKPRMPVRPVQRENFHFRRKFFRLGHPVEDEARRANDQMRLRSSRGDEALIFSPFALNFSMSFLTSAATSLNKRQCLQRFTQTHFVGENAAESVFA